MPKAITKIIVKEAYLASEERDIFGRKAWRFLRPLMISNDFLNSLDSADKLPLNG